MPAPATVPAPELSSMATALEDLTRRVTAIAEGLANTQADWAAQELFAVERSLGAGYRRLVALNDRLRKLP
ncbi:MAG: hypothetical protein M3326_10000 [Actinomycetota bacterium]|nr:hypothetical protein [Actinomycetota bacterium]